VGQAATQSHANAQNAWDGATACPTYDSLSRRERDKRELTKQILTRVAA
jgi:hypothetical protein